ncbi:MAG: helix-turn-helix domain-containing protein [Motilibacteraceae bacterium]
MANLEPLLTEEELAQYLRVSRETVRQWRKNRVNKVRDAERGPDCTYAGRKVLYRLSVVSQWLEANTDGRPC